MDHYTTEQNREERNMGAIVHALAFSGVIIPFGNFIGPLVFWLMKKDGSPFVDFHGKECLNFQISLFIWLACCALLCIIFIGIPLLIIVGIFGLVMPIIAVVKAHNGEYYEFPMTIRFLK